MAGAEHAEKKPLTLLILLLLRLFHQSNYPVGRFRKKDQVQQQLHMHLHARTVPVWRLDLLGRFKRGVNQSIRSVTGNLRVTEHRVGSSCFFLSFFSFQAALVKEILDITKEISSVG